MKLKRLFCEIDGSQGVVFFAAGVFYYFRKHEVKALIHKMARHFPGSRLLFDTAGKKAVAMMIKTWVKQVGIEKVDAFFCVNDVEKDVVPWMKGARVTSRGYMLGYNDLKASTVSPFFRFLAKLGDSKMRMQIVRMDFEEGERKERRAT